jgi:DNA repair exonuclease SbcCD ATPase subunit
VEKERKNKDETKKNFSQSSRDVEKYRASAVAAMEQLLQELGKDYNPSGNSEVVMVAFPDDRISSLQVEAIKKRNNIMAKYQQEIRSQATHSASLEEELASAKKTTSQRMEELEAMVGRERAKLKAAQSEFLL